MHYTELASKVRTKYPGVYDDMDDATLAHKIVDKYPDAYSDTTFDEGPGKLEAGARGLAQGLTLGHADELTGAVEHLATGKPYEQARDESRANYDAAKEAHPFVYGAADAAGSIPGYVGATAVTGGNPVAGAALAGAIQGEGNSTGTSLKDVAKDTAVGGVVGAAAGKLGAVVASKLAPEALSQVAEENAVKAAGAKMTDFKNLGADKLRSAGRTMLDQGIITPTADTEAMQMATDEAQAYASNTIHDYLKDASASGELGDPNQFIEALEGLKRPAGGYNDAHNAAIENAIQTVKAYAPKSVNNMRGVLPDGPEYGPMNWGVLNKVKGILQGAGKWTLGEDTVAGSAKRQAAGVFRNTLDTGLEDVTNNPEATSEFKDAKKVFGNTEIVDDLLQKRQARELGNATFGPLEMMAGAAEGVASGNPVKGLGMAAAWKMMRRYGNQNVALAADWIAKNEQAAAQQLGKYAPAIINAAKQGPSALAVTHYILSQQDPSYRQLSSGSENE